ncbi:tRNA preQ1(34) S-adenosylmethionine ribosyltransferase-isomerase QueA [Sutterella sp.]|uniref:tRNA preQ1(34) S-adenosylmethionine ribosyltransferase-isomerase QueA n=1 Tax=Sutterella sp. TaxID=1981025 RepID=UPI0026E013CB|nr:tRNA preQ1(34) S-adenosylmethionine ribosyltransferase-isomerase QueA [Sutterella sp.]MDO5531747.1 tRNA preQ1(34) S-adenosylmethionine ribosyltransferase-isomerase QueA [Sutterella sp.]
MPEQHLSDFDFELPPELIAQYPLADRASSRLLHITEDVLEDKTFRDIENFLRPGDLLIANDTRVIKARLLGRKATGGAVEALIERVTGEFTAISMIRASKSPKPGSKVLFATPGDDAVTAEVEVTGREGEFFALRFEKPVLEVLEAFGRVPLPPYITHAPEKSDESRYQTVYAEHPGAVAAPTAGLHFTEELLERIRARGVDIEYVTLHVGAGTFQPVRVENLSEHHMHSEWYSMPADVAAKINAAKADGRRVIAVGTTSLRTLESAADRVGHVEAGARDTALFITPGYKFRIVDALVTNFHLPKSTLVMLVSALVGRERILEAYRHAVQERYRFFSYGDACFIEKARGS